jgi:predicted DCC family thiol-disulfide oxidoreductase YuxK
MTNLQQLEYALSMFDRLPDDTNKMNRWLGFIQGVMWSNNVATIDQMRDINRHTEYIFETKHILSNHIQHLKNIPD